MRTERNSPLRMRCSRVSSTLRLSYGAPGYQDSSAKTNDSETFSSPEISVSPNTAAGPGSRV